MMNKYKTFEELKKELGDKYDKYMYEINLDLLNKITKTIEYNKQIIEDTKSFYRPTADRIYSGDCLIDIAEQNISILGGAVADE